MNTLSQNKITFWNTWDSFGGTQSNPWGTHWKRRGRFGGCRTNRMILSCCLCHILLKYGITVTQLHAFVTYFMPIQHLCFCVYLDLLVQSSDNAWEKAWIVQFVIHGLSDGMAFQIFSVDTVNLCFNSSLLNTVAVIARNDTCGQQNWLVGVLHNYTVNWSPQQSPDQ